MIIAPCGKHQHAGMAMGLKLAPDVAQSVAEKALQGVDVCVDDIGTFTKTWEDHLKMINLVLMD